MKSIRCAAILSFVTVVVAVTARDAVAAGSTPTTLPAQSVTATTATLEGTVDTHGVATFYQFQYGRTINYGRATIAKMIPAGQGTVSVSAVITGLRPASRYHFRLVAQAGIGTNYYPLVLNFASPRSFVTGQTGKLKLAGAKLSVSNRIAPAKLTCVSSVTCKGTARLTMPTGHGKHRHVITLARKSFKVRAHRRATVKLKLSKKAANLLAAARGQRLKASLVATTTTGQVSLSQPVSLTLH